MSPTWEGPPEPPRPDLTWREWLRVLRRGGASILLLAVAFPLLLLLRGPERLIWGVNRPVTPWITQAVCVAICAFFGLRRETMGRPMAMRGAFVANHGSWLDILVLNAGKRLFFVAKAEVAGWPGIGWLARGTGTLFITRDRSRAKAQTDLLRERLLAGHKMLFFPEGTSTDGRRVLAFKPALFEAFLEDRLRPHLHIQPVSVIYTAPAGAAPEFYGWWGGMGLAGSLLAILSVRRQGRVTVIYHPPLKVADFADRKALAKAAEVAVRGGVMDRL